MTESYDNSTISVVDDDSIIRLSTTRLLRKEGYTVAEASSGTEGEALIRETPPDLVLMDVNPGEPPLHRQPESLEREGNA